MPTPTANVISGHYLGIRNHRQDGQSTLHLRTPIAVRTSLSPRRQAEVMMPTSNMILIVEWIHLDLLFGSATSRSLTLNLRDSSTFISNLPMTETPTTVTLTTMTHTHMRQTLIHNSTRQ